MGVYRKEWTPVEQDEFDKGDLVKMVGEVEEKRGFGIFLSCNTLKIYDCLKEEYLPGETSDYTGKPLKTLFYHVLDQKTDKIRELTRDQIELVQKIEQDT